MRPSVVLIISVHYIYIFFKNNLTVPKTKDLVNKPSEQYKKIYKSLNENKEKSKEKIKGVIKKTASKKFNALAEWKEANPDFMNNEDKTDYFTKTISTRLL